MECLSQCVLSRVPRGVPGGVHLQLAQAAWPGCPRIAPLDQLSFSPPCSLWSCPPVGKGTALGTP